MKLLVLLTASLLAVFVDNHTESWIDHQVAKQLGYAPGSIRIPFGTRFKSIAPHDLQKGISLYQASSIAHQNIVAFMSKFQRIVDELRNPTDERTVHGSNKYQMAARKLVAMSQRDLLIAKSLQEESDNAAKQYELWRSVVNLGLKSSEPSSRPRRRVSFSDER